MPGPRPGAREPEFPAPVPQEDVLEGGWEPGPWRRRWAALPPRRRLLAGALAALVAIGAGGLWAADRAAERALARRVDLTASLGVWSSSSAPMGGAVSYFVVVRNEGPRPVRVDSLDGSVDGLRLAARGDAGQRVGTGSEVTVPVSVRLTCSAYRGGDGEAVEGIDARVSVRREDGGRATRRVPLASADLVLGVATTLCTVRPDARDRELSGPVLAAP